MPQGATHPEQGEDYVKASSHVRSDPEVFRQPEFNSDPLLIKRERPMKIDAP
jgi:hypothetical protein